MWRIPVALATILVMSAAPATGQPCTNNAGDIVDRLYRQILEREPDASSARHVQQLQSGRLTVRQLAAELAKSTEHRAMLWAPVVEATFRQLRNAAPQREHTRTLSRAPAIASASCTRSCSF